MPRRFTGSDKSSSDRDALTAHRTWVCDSAKVSDWIGVVKGSSRRAEAVRSNGLRAFLENPYLLSVRLKAFYEVINVPLSRPTNRPAKQPLIHLLTHNQRTADPRRGFRRCQMRPTHRGNFPQLKRVRQLGSLSRIRVSLKCRVPRMVWRPLWRTAETSRGP